MSLVLAATLPGWLPRLPSAVTWPLVLRWALRADGGLPRGGPGVSAHTTGPTMPDALLCSSRAGGQGRPGEQGPQQWAALPPTSPD